MRIKLLSPILILLASSCNNSTCGPDCIDAEESSVQTSVPQTIPTTPVQTIPFCTAEGQTGCMVDGVNFKVIKPADLDPWDIRVGTTIAGVSGKLKSSCRNRVQSVIYNYDGDVASIGNASQVGGVTLDIWDTIDDYNFGVTGLPQDTVADWNADTDCSGLEVDSGDSYVWKDVTTDGAGDLSTCTAEPTRCTLQDKITGLSWSRGQGLANWGTAWSLCVNLEHNSKNDWRLPTQKELMQAYLHGIRSVASAEWMSEATLNNYFWSGTSVSNGTANAWSTVLSDGRTFSGAKTGLRQVTCVR